MSSRLFLIPFLSVLLPPGLIEAGDNSLAVLTFNIRYGTAKDEGHAWDTRKEAVAEVVRERHPDLAGLQEALDFQVEYLRSRLREEYTFVGEGREGGTRGEYSPILFRSERFDLARAGRFWLSDTPEAVGSKTWASLPRIVTWVDLFDRTQQIRIVVLNTHWAHDSEEARLKSANLVRDKVGEIADGGTPVILMGDFNCVPDSEPYRVLLGGDAGAFEDAFSLGKDTPKSTFHGFRERAKEGGPIDWILFRGGFRPTEYRVLDGEYLGELPSDHYPVFANLNR